MGKQKTLTKNIVLNTFYQVLLVIVPLVTAPYISRVLMADGIGVYSYTHSLVTYFSIFAALGTISYGTREIARNRDNQSEYSKKFWEIEILVAITTGISLTLWSLLVTFYAEYRLFFLILTIQILSVCFDISWFYSGLEKFHYTVLVNSLFKIAGCVSIFVFVKGQKDLWIYFLINSLSLFLGHLSMWLFLPKLLCKSKPDIKSARVHIKGTLVFFIPTIATSIYTLLDKTLIGLLIPGEITIEENGLEVVKKISELENGYYEQATKIVNIIKAVCFTGIVGVMTSRSSYLYKINDNIGAKKILLTTFNITSFLSIGACFGLLAIAQYFVPTFFGEGYNQTIILLYILAPLIIVISFSYTLGGVYYNPVGKRKQSAIYLVIGALANLVLNIPFIIFWKSTGAAIASLTAETIICFLYLKGCSNSITVKELFLIVWKKLIAGFIMLCVVFVFSYFLNKYINKYIFLFLQVTIGIVSYLSLVVAFKDKSFSQLLSLLTNRQKKSKKETAMQLDSSEESDY